MDLILPRGALGVVVLFAVPTAEPDGIVGAVAEELRRAGVGTVSVAPLPYGAAEDAGRRSGIGTMAERLEGVVDRLARERRTQKLPVGCLATGTAGAAALRAAAARDGVRALVVVEGRPDLAGSAVERVKAPTLLVVGGVDTPLLRLNHQALRRLKCPALLEVVPGAMRGLDDREARELAIPRIVDWLCTHLGVREPARAGERSGVVRHPLFVTP